MERVRNGVDAETLFATLDAVKAQPELGTFPFRVANEWIDGAHNRPHAGPPARETAMATHTDTLIIGAGQGGLALSYHLSSAGHEHVVVERGRVAQRWRERWDTLTLLSPNRMNALPGGAPYADPGGFLDRRAFICSATSTGRSRMCATSRPRSAFRSFP